MKPSAILFGASALALLAPSGARAYDYPLIPAPLPAPPAVASAPVRASGASPLLFLEPFQDLRRDRELWHGDTRFQSVGMEAEGLDALPKAWRRDAYGDYALLWHRQLAQALAQRGVAVAADGLPGADEAPTARADQGAVLEGDITGLAMDKRGADGIFGTDFNGNDYGFTLGLRLRLLSFVPGVQGADQAWSFAHTFRDPTHFGRPDHETFPVYFAQGLSLAAQSLADAVALRLGLKPRTKPIPPSAGPGGAQGYWVNPRTGRRMDPTWNFDPQDGTPRRDFVFHPADGSAAAPDTGTAQAQP